MKILFSLIIIGLHRSSSVKWNKLSQVREKETKMKKSRTKNIYNLSLLALLCLLDDSG